MFPSARKLLSILTLGIVLLLIGSNGWAFPNLLTDFNTTYGTAGTRLDTCGTCHFDFNGGGALNPYATNQAEGADPDADQATSLAEIDALFMPGYSCANYTQAVNAPANLATYVDPANPGCGPVVATTVVASVLPSSRSVQINTPATAFATIINAGTTDATGCGITPAQTPVIPATFLYQTTDAGNNLTGTQDTPADIAAGGQQNYLIAITPNGAFDPVDLEFEFACDNTDPAPVTSGLNTLLISASATAIPDIVALSATINNDNYTDIPGDTGTGVFAVAAVNVGEADNSITVSSVLSDAALPVAVSLCETDTSGNCLADPTPTVTTNIGADATASFAAFVAGSGNVADDPAANRITVQFVDSAQVVRGATSVAVRTITAVPTATP